MPFEPRFTITNPITAALTKIERARGFLEAAKLSQDWLDRMRDRALILEATHTNRIEGTEVTTEQTERVLRGQPAPDVEPDAARELRNYRESFNLVSEYLGSGEPITEGLIREIHRRLVQGVGGNAAAPGEYRKIQNYVVNSVTREVIYTPPPPLEVPGLMTEFVDWLRNETTINSLLVAGIAQFQLVHIHPFVDGNGRSARLLSTLQLFRTGYDFKQLFTLSEYYDRDRQAYYRALQSVRQDELNLTDWLEYFTEGLATQLREVQERGERVIRADVLALNHGLSERQRGALRQAMDVGAVTIQELEQLFPDVGRRTLQRDIRELVEKELLVPEGATNRLRYRPRLS